MEIWEPKPPGSLWATPGLLRDSFTFTLNTSLYCNIRVYDTVYSGSFVPFLIGLEKFKI